MVIIGIIEYHTPGLTNIAIESALAKPGIDCKMIVVANSHSTAKRLKKFAGELFINRRNLGFTKAANQILKASGDNDVVLLNSDTKCEDNWLRELNNAVYMDLGKKIGMACPRLVEKYSLHKNKQCAHAGSGCDNGTGPWTFKGWFGFACAYLRRDMINDIGWLNERHFNYGSDKEYGLLAARKGYYTVHTHNSIVHHLVAASTKRSRQW